MSQVIVLQSEDDLRILSESIADIVYGLIQEKMKAAEQAQSNRLLTASELAAKLGVTRTMLYRLVREGQLTCHKVGGSLRFDNNDVTDALERMKQ